LEYKYGMLNEFYTNQIKNLSAELLLLKEQYNKLVNLNEEEAASARRYDPRTFNTILEPHEEEMFSKFAETAKLKNESMSNHYDLRAFYLDNVTPEVNGTEIAFSIKPKFKQRDGSFILPDTYKKPSHPTFSEESMYHGANNHEGISQLGGRWVKVGKSSEDSRDRLQADNVFIAHPTQIDTPEKESALLSHFREVEPNHVLVHPVSMEVLHHPTFIPSEKDYKQSSDDYARMRIERLKGLPQSTASVVLPVEVESPRLQDLMQRMYGTRGGGAVGGGQVLPPATVTHKVAARVSDVMDETGGLNQDEIEKTASSGAFERQSRIGDFALAAPGRRRGTGAIKLILPQRASKKDYPFYLIPNSSGGNFAATDLSNITNLGTFGGNPIRAGEAEFESIYGLEGADDSIRHKGSRVSYQIRGDPTGIQRAMRPGPKEERRRTEELIYQPRLSRRAVRSIEDLQADYEGVVGEINAHIEKHDITDEEIRTVKKKSHEELKQDVRDLFAARRVKFTSSQGFGRPEFPPDYRRKRALRDLKSKIILADRLKSSIENYDPSAQSEPEYDPTERLYDAMRNAGTLPATDPATLRGNKGIGIEEYPVLSNLIATAGGSEGKNNSLNAMREIRRRFYRDAEERRNREAEEARQAEESKPEAMAARLKQIEQDLAALKRERDDAFAAAEEKRVAGPREIDTGLSAEEIEKIGPNRKKTSRSKYVRKSERVKLEAEAQESKSRMEKEAEVLAKKQAEQRAEFESMLARDFPDLEPERYSAVTPEKVSGRGADLARDLAYRASARRKGVPLAKRPDFIRYLGEAVLNISRARTIS
jgi:hypothetical protein